MTKDKLTDKDCQEYAENPHRCPYCKSENIANEDGPELIDNTCITIDVTCHDCSRQWHEIFLLSTIEEKDV